MTVRFNPNGRVVSRAQLNYTADKNVWKQRLWVAQEVEANACSGEVKAEIPAAATVYYVNLFTDDGLAVSTEHEEL